MPETPTAAAMEAALKRAEAAEDEARRYKQHHLDDLVRLTTRYNTAEERVRVLEAALLDTINALVQAARWEATEYGWCWCGAARTPGSERFTHLVLGTPGGNHDQRCDHAKKQVVAARAVLKAAAAPVVRQNRTTDSCPYKDECDSRGEHVAPDCPEEAR